MSKEKNIVGRSWVAVAAHMRNSAGAHGPSKKQKNKRDRQSVKKEINNEKNMD
jgi:hypothetical protein